MYSYIQISNTHWTRTKRKKEILLLYYSLYSSFCSLKIILLLYIILYYILLIHSNYISCVRERIIIITRLFVMLDNLARSLISINSRGGKMRQAERGKRVSSLCRELYGVVYPEHSVAPTMDREVNGIRRHCRDVMKWKMKDNDFPKAYPPLFAEPFSAFAHSSL